MGGFGMSIPGLAPEPIQGDSLTQYLRSLTNQGGSVAPQMWNSGTSMTGTGFGTLGTALDTSKTALATTQPAIDYWTAIMQGDPAALTKATAPTANALSTVYSGAMNNTSQFAPQGGYRSATLAQLPQAQASQVGNYLLGLQPTAAQNLNTLAGTQAGIANTQGGIGSAQGQLGLGTSSLGTQIYSAVLNALLGRRGQNVQQDMSNMGLLTGGLETLATGGMNTSAFKSLSDIDAKAGLLPLGIVDGVPVYAWRYKDTGELAMGVIAQEVQHVVPEAVSRGRDGLLRVDYDRLFRTLRLGRAA